jgi:hypothetical protein
MELIVNNDDKPATVGPDCGAPPSGERPAPTPQELFDRARDAVAALRASGSQCDRETGRFLPGDTRNLKHGLRSERLVDQPDIAAWHREQVTEITTDLGGDAELTALARASVREIARLEVILAALGTELLQGGVLTGKGKTRAATTTYLQVLDRFTRLAATLGLERRQKRVDSFAAAVAQEPARE